VTRRCPRPDFFYNEDVVRQQLLILCLATPELGSPVTAWSFYDGTGRAPGMSGDSPTPPYPSVLAAMAEGWRVIQLPLPPPRLPGHEHETSLLRYEYVLEKLVDG
jgi:hypothetical protein